MDVDKIVWRKSSRSGSNGGACVELATIGDVVAVRDSKDPGGPMILLGRTALREAIRKARQGSGEL
ncbi:MULTISPECIES: DUF397 domain-containing protein [Actinomadura]|uniref:DUF397 domain-containing protein n=1 Tax=Actinomadura yumaensis TaxID=111807 RepID=A0ABW2CMA8_9ACTN|nr:DUF397 domain-containing protein [Actinomadura sp. J1-007]MWK34338.1 DUF397 domain-containing protein [Actinomadura sp. J1-007]